MDLVAQALADATRRQILRMLRDRQLSAGAIAGAFDITRPAISRHLRVLREAGLVVDEPQGRERVYRLELRALDELEAFLAGLRDKSHERGARSDAEGGAKVNDSGAAWERRFMALETEVHRTKRDRAKEAATSRVTTDDKKKETA